MTGLISHIIERMRVRRWESWGRWRIGGPRRTVWMTRRKAALLSVIHRKVHLCRHPQCRDIAAISRRAEVKPQSSL